MKICIFYPTSAKKLNAFDNSERKVFEYLVEKYDLDITLFVDSLNNYPYRGSALKIKEISPFMSKFNIFFKVFNRKVFHFIPFPVYPELIIRNTLSQYDIVLTDSPWNAVTLYPYFSSRKYIIIDSEILHRKVNRIILNIIKNACRICALTPLVVKKYEDLNGLTKEDISKIRLIGGHPINIDLYKPPDNNCKNDSIINIVSTGRIVYEKGFHIVLESFKMVLRRYKNVILHIIGDGPFRTKLEEIIKKSDRLAEHVVFHGTLNPEKIADIYKAAHIYVNHSLNKPTRSEAFGVANLEAMAAGLPVITTDCGAIKWVTQGNAIIINQGDIVNLAESICYLISNKCQRISMGENGRKFVVSNYTVDIIAERYYQIINEIITDGKNSNS